MNSNPKFSIIVPVYKAEKYLAQNVETILCQTFTDFEVLLVDDGSPDNSGMICDELAAKDYRVKVHHQENSGPSAARNYALAHAQGDWICFMDADDHVNPDWLEMYSKNCDADVIFQGVNIKGIKGNETIENLPKLFQEEDGRYKLLEQVHTDLIGATWSKCMRAEIIRDNELRFEETVKLSEDWIFMMEFLCVSNSIRTLDCAGYCYVKENSFLTTIRYETSELLNIKRKVMDSVDKFYNFHKNEVSYRMICNRQVGNALYFLMIASTNATCEVRFEMYSWVKQYMDYIDFSKLEKNRYIYKLLFLPLTIFDKLFVVYASTYNLIKDIIKK